MWFVGGLLFVLIVVFVIRKEYKENVKTNVTNHGGMLIKYSRLVDYFKEGGIPLKKLTEDSIIFSSNSMTWTIDYVSKKLEIRLIGYMPLIGKYSKSWSFPEDYPQEKMIEEFDNYLTWQMKRIDDVSRSTNECFSK